MIHDVNTKWKGNMAFESDINGHKLTMDANEADGGENMGPRPKPLMLAALAGCTGMDVASLLKKMRLSVDDFSIDVKGEMTEEHPKHYHAIKVVYTFFGSNLNKDKIKKAVEMSQERYCGVSEMLRKASDLTYEIVYHQA